jgi:hypothetical protein
MTGRLLVEARALGRQGHIGFGRGLMVRRGDCGRGDGRIGTGETFDWEVVLVRVVIPPCRPGDQLRISAVLAAFAAEALITPTGGIC